MDHGISCSCERCIGLRLYPQPSMCDWCKTIHAGNSSNCPDNEEEREVDWSGVRDDVEQYVWIVINQVKQITATIKEKVEMLPEPTVGRQQTNQGGSGRSSGGGRSKRSGLAYLNNDSPLLSLDKKKTKILAVKANPPQEGRQNFSDVVVKLALSGESVLWGLKTNNPNFEILTEEFGRDENDWVGKEFMIGLEEDDFDHRKWIRIETMPKKPKAGK